MKDRSCGFQGRIVTSGPALKLFFAPRHDGEILILSSVLAALFTLVGEQDLCPVFKLSELRFEDYSPEAESLPFGVFNGKDRVLAILALLHLAALEDAFELVADFRCPLAARLYFI